MFGVKIQGRLGNQLFQYAYALVLRKKFDTVFFLLNRKRFYADRYFDLGLDTPLQNTMKQVGFFLKNALKPVQITEDQMAHPDVNRANERDNVVYDGFYQSDLFHTGMRKELQQLFSVKPEFRLNIADFTGNNKPNLVVHIRRTDYINFGGAHTGGINLTLPEGYYHEALERLPVSECNVIFLSDDIAFVKEQFRIAGAIYSERNTEIADLQLLMQADYLVLANSSFSWWGAYLNTAVKKVIAPKYWLGIKIHKEYPVGIVRQEWEGI